MVDSTSITTYFFVLLFCVFIAIVTWMLYAVLTSPEFRKWWQRKRERVAEQRRLAQKQVAEQKRLVQEREAHLRYVNDPANFKSISHADREELGKMLSQKIAKFRPVPGFIKVAPTSDLNGYMGALLSMDRVTLDLASGSPTIAFDSDGFIVAVRKSFLPPEQVVNRYLPRTTTSGRVTQGRKKKDSEFNSEYLNNHVAKATLEIAGQVFHIHKLIHTVIFSGSTRLLDDYGHFEQTCFLSVAIDRSLFERLNLTNSPR